MFSDFKQQGFIRARVDGVVYELDEVPELDAKKKHTIELVVDRFKVREDIKTRLAESFETALLLANDVATIAWMDPDDKNRAIKTMPTSSSRQNLPARTVVTACRNWSRACSRLTIPQAPARECEGIGHNNFFDPERVISPHLSLAGGAIRGWDRRNAYYFSIIQSLAKHYDFDIDIPFQELA